MRNRNLYIFNNSAPELTEERISKKKLLRFLKMVSLINLKLGHALPFNQYTHIFLMKYTSLQAKSEKKIFQKVISDLHLSCIWR